MTSFESSFSNTHNMDIPGSTVNLNSNTVPENLNTSEKTQPKKRLTYSRRGCTSCKQRRKKCSNTTGDGKMCWDCERLGKECIYIYNPKNVKRKTSPRKKVEKKPKVKKNEVKRNYKIWLILNLIKRNLLPMTALQTSKWKPSMIIKTFL